MIRILFLLPLKRAAVEVAELELVRKRKKAAVADKLQDERCQM